MDKLCNGDLDTPFMIECWDLDDHHVNHDHLIGWTEATVRQMMTKMPLVLNDRRGGNTEKPGSLVTDSISIISSTLGRVCEVQARKGWGEGEVGNLADLRASISGTFNVFFRSRARGKERGVKNGGVWGGRGLYLLSCINTCHVYICMSKCIIYIKYKTCLHAKE